MSCASTEISYYLGLMGLWGIYKKAVEVETRAEKMRKGAVIFDCSDAKENLNKQEWDSQTEGKFVFFGDRGL
jgi:hypothetical protein